MGDVVAAVGEPAAQPLPAVTGVTLSSQRVRPGDLYVALPGASVHGARFAAAAVSAGAVAVLTDAQGAAMLGAETGVPVLVTPSPRGILGRVAAQVYGSPAERLTLLAVTGTQGKTTTTRLLEAAMSGAGIAAAAIGTVGTRIAGADVKTALTTPESPDLHGLFARMVEEGVEVCAMEVSSHALVMGRVDGVVFDVAAFVNLGRDHLDFHTDMEDYFAAKASLFTPERARRGLTNIDDEYGRRLLEVAGIPMLTFSLEDGAADWSATQIVESTDGSTFLARGPGGLEAQVRVPIPGRFNVANALCALALAGEAGLDVHAIAAAMADVPGVPGRLERIDSGQGFLAVVDYAHKPDAVAAAIAALRPMTTGRLIVVLGAGGDRDRGKRPLMGRIAAELSDVVIVTDDNPRTEDPGSIRAEVVAGARDADAGIAEVREIGGRRAAIREAIDLAGPGDTVLVAGKGHETGQEIDGVVHPFDDRDEVRAALAARGAGR
ncbi:MAG TPA: UDP-N-acetylmuramoyl-L-alanyl-D-glutamate--2,6-diaminopimelate ligase [Marmoricola sp.]